LGGTVLIFKDESGEVFSMSKQSVYFLIDGTADRHDVKQIKKGIAKIPGVLSVSIAAGANRVAVDYDSTGTDPNAIGEHLRALGLEARFSGNVDPIM
jgi:copper chaperone CopZ